MQMTKDPGLKTDADLREENGQKQEVQNICGSV
jgi:hypothetical protein